MMVNQLACIPIAEAQLRSWNETNCKSLARIVYKFLLMLGAVARKAAISQMKSLWTKLIDWPLPLKGFLH